MFTLKSKITDASRAVFLSKCNDRNRDIKEVYKAYKTYRKIVKISNKARIIVEKNFFEDFKEDYYKYMSREQQKDIEAAS
jgi:hypothetical protein